MPYDKPWHSCEEMIDKLRARGLSITDEEKALSYLSRIGYYRLSGYWYAFRQFTGLCCPIPKQKGKKGRPQRLALDHFEQGARFEDAIKLYVFDKKLRLLIMDALERIEVAFRVEIAHLLGQRDTFAYLDKNQFFSKFSQSIDPQTGLTKHHEWLTKQAGLIRRSREKFIEHNKNKHGLPLPIWIACEVWDFGALSLLYDGMKEEDQDAIAAKFGLHNGRVLAKWLRSLNYLRNVCAHHSRLWNRNIIDQPSLPSSKEVPWVQHFEGTGREKERLRARPFMLFCITKHLMDYINPNSTWWMRLTDLMMNEFPEMTHIGLDLNSMGVIENWNTLFLEEEK